MKTPFYDLLLVPTAGRRVVGVSGETGETVYEPGSAGQRRIQAALELCQSGGARKLAIIGGKRIHGPSEAEVHKAFLLGLDQTAEQYLAFIQAEETCTNRDILVALPEIDAYGKEIGKTSRDITIGVVSYEQHAKRAEIVLQHHGFRRVTHCPSGEASEMDPGIEQLLTLITLLDPDWKHLGLLLVWWANHRINLKTE